MMDSAHSFEPDSAEFPREMPFSRSSCFFPASQLEGKPIPPRPWLVQDLVPRDTVTLLGGDGGTGKSLLALQLAVAVSTGRQWIGRSVAEGGALFISAEDDLDELHRRLADITTQEGLQLADLERLTLRSLAGEDAMLAISNRNTGALVPSGLYAELDRRIDAERPCLVVLDTLADLFPGNENDRAQARQFVGLLRALAIRHECAVLLLAHPSLSGLNNGTGTSGSTGWNNSVRSRLYLERVQHEGYKATPDARVLKNMKSNYGRTGGEIRLSWRAGVFVADAVETGLDRNAGSIKAERVFLKLLRSFTEMDRKVNGSGGQTYAPNLFAKSPNAEGCSSRALRGAMEVLFSSGKIAVVKDGPPSKRRSFLVVAGEA